MRILHLSTGDHGGAGSAAHGLHRKLLARGIDSRMWVLSKRTADPTVTAVSRPAVLARAARLTARLYQKLRCNPDYYFQDPMRSALPGVAWPGEGSPDLIVAHWIANFASPRDLRRLQACFNVPVIWYLMDMAPLTGGCHYAWDCTGYMKQCGCCPALRSSNPRDRSFAVLNEKHDCIRQMDITLVAGSRLIGQAEKASVFQGKRKEEIMLGVDPDVFRPRPRSEARSRLGLPADRKILFAGSLSMRVKRKGMQYFLEALRTLERAGELARDSVVIATAGCAEMKRYLQGSAFGHVHLGHLDTDGLVMAYQAADAFVCPSIEDAGPMMIKEAVMCGTPVVSFDMGVAADLVHTGVTGYLARLRDSADLASGMSQVLGQGPEAAREMAGNCRAVGLRVANADVQVDAFVSLAGELAAAGHT